MSQETRLAGLGDAAHQVVCSSFRTLEHLNHLFLHLIVVVARIRLASSRSFRVLFWVLPVHSFHINTSTL
jgi:hypothetical protein